MITLAEGAVVRKTIETSVEIDASAETVWRLLVDVQNFREWNPFVKAIEGELLIGRKIHVAISPPRGRAMTFSARVSAASFPELRWRGTLLFRRVFSGEHYFRVEELSPNRVRFVQGEDFSGLLVRPLAGMLDDSKVGFELMNQALKARAEAAR